MELSECGGEAGGGIKGEFPNVWLSNWVDGGMSKRGKTCRLGGDFKNQTETPRRSSEKMPG